MILGSRLLLTLSVPCDAALPFSDTRDSGSGGRTLWPRSLTGPLRISAATRTD